MTRSGGAAGAARAAPLADEARALLRPEHTPRQYLDALIKTGYLADAVRFIGFLLSRREAVWWATQCTRQVPDLATGPHLPALAAAEAWVADPTDERRRAAFVAGEAAGFGTAAACAALAAFLSDGSLAPPHVQAVPPPPDAGPLAASNGVLLAAVTVEPAKAEDKLKQFLTLGAEVANGTNRWPEAKPIAPRPTVAPPAPPPGPMSPPPPSSPRSWY